MDDNKTKKLQDMFLPKTSIVEKLTINGATTCKFFLEHNYWAQMLPLESPPQKGEDVVHHFINDDAEQYVKDAFIKGWNNYLEDPAFLG